MIRYYDKKGLHMEETEYRHLSLLKERDPKTADAFAHALAVSFQGYPLFEHFSNYKYSVPKMEYFWKVTLKTVWDSAYLVQDSEQLNSAIVSLPCAQSHTSFWTYVRTGGLGIPLRLGLRSALGLLHFEEFAKKIKSKYVTDSCHYLFAFVTLPEARGKGYGSIALKELLRFYDEEHLDCYLETLTPTNVEIYKKHGFCLMEEVSVPNTDLVLYAMYRRAQGCAEEEPQEERT